jgi:hypothetical protein
MEPKTVVAMIVVVAVVLVLAGAAVVYMLMQAPSDDYDGESDFTLLSDDRIEKGVTTYFSIDAGIKMGAKFVVKSVDDGMVTCDVSIMGFPTAEERIPVKDFYNEALLPMDEGDIPDSAVKLSVLYRGVEMILYDFSGHCEVDGEEYDFEEAQFYVYKGYLIDAVATIDNGGQKASFTLETKLYKA